MPDFPKFPAPPTLSSIFRRGNPIHKVMEDTTQAIQGARTDIATLAGVLRVQDTTVRTVQTTQTAVHQVDEVAEVADDIELPSEEETVIELQRRLIEQIANAEGDLTNKLKIAGKPCSCLEGKHNLVIEAAAKELIGKDASNPVYSQVIDWFHKNEPKMTVRASASGKFDTEYPKMSDEVARFRRLITRDMIRRSPKVDLDALANQTTAPSSVAVKPTSAGTLRIKDFLKVAKKTPEA